MRKSGNLRLPNWAGLGIIFFSITLSTNAFANHYMEQEDMKALIKQARDA